MNYSFIGSSYSKLTNRTHSGLNQVYNQPINRNKISHRSHNTSWAEWKYQAEILWLFITIYLICEFPCNVLASSFSSLLWGWVQFSRWKQVIWVKSFESWYQKHLIFYLHHKICNVYIYHYTNICQIQSRNQWLIMSVAYDLTLEISLVLCHFLVVDSQLGFWSVWWILKTVFKSSVIKLVIS